MPRSGAYEFLTRPMCDAWNGLIRRGLEAKKDFNERGAQIEQFYSAGSGFMWQPDYLNRFMGGASNIRSPKFKVTSGKAFEFVALMGPMLFWQMASRKVRPHRAMQLDPMALAGGDELMAQFYSQLADEQATGDAKNSMRAAVLEHLLNYFQREQPGGGLTAHSGLAVFEAMIKGAGFLQTEHYRFPFSERTLVQSAHVPTDNVIVDPDCRDPLWGRAKWVAIRHRWHFAEVEDYFRMPPGSMRDHCTSASAGANWQGGRTDLPPTKRSEVAHDTIEWYEIFSRAGMGNRLCGAKRIIEPEFEDAAGDFVYMCIAKNCPYPLNMPSGMLADEEANEDFVREALAWPTEYWRDNKWPISKLDFYPHSGTSLWPEPPLAPAVGELTVLNILMSAWIQTAYDSSFTVMGVAKGMLEEAALQNLKSPNVSPLVVELDTNFKQTIDQVITYLNRPEINGDVPKAIQFLMGLIEQRTGLSDMLYGENAGGSNPRSAAEYTGKMATVNIRPDYMRKKVAEWQSEVADKEVFCMYSHVRSDDVAEQLGPLGVAAYDELVTNEEPEAILRGSKCYVEASEMARPNKERDAEMLVSLQQYLMPVLSGHAAQFNDPKPLNEFLKAIGHATEIEVDKFLIPPPEPDNEALQMQQAMQQAELAKIQAEAAKLNSEAESAGNEGMMRQQEAMTKQQVAMQQAELKKTLAEHGMQVKSQEAALKAETSAQQMEHKRQSAEQQLAMKQKQFEFDAAKQQADGQLKQAAGMQSMAQREQEARQKLALQLMQARQGLQQKAVTHQQGVQQSDEKATADARRNNTIMASRMLMDAVKTQQRTSQNGAAR